ncbi:hypothetical protein [Roseomonas chloroacetimidivorans]|uniref:hypothetical protein n=1 Tax=Roseomonas chloroacetimidivorans TaxID=1766656 RepID=UPI003C75363B
MASSTSAIRLVGSSSLAPSVSFTRASGAIYTGQDNTTLYQVGNDVPRFNGPAKRLLIEGQRTNYIRNPRFDGATAPTTGPTYTTGFVGNASGVARTIVGTGTAFGRPYIDVAFTGTSSVNQLHTVNFENAGVAAAEGQVWTLSGAVMLISGSFAGYNTCNLNVRPRDASNVDTNGTGYYSAPITPETATPVLATVTSGALPATTASIQTVLRMNTLAGQVCNEVFRIFAPQLELAPFASSLILPPVGTPALTTRANDLATYLLTAAHRQRGTLVGTFMLPQAAGADIQCLLSLDPNNSGNRLTIQNSSNGAQLRGVQIIAGATAQTSVLATFTPSVPFRAAIAWDATGVSWCVMGSAVSTLAGLPEIDRLRLGNDVLGQRAAFGEFGVLDLYPTRLPDPVLQALTS